MDDTNYTWSDLQNALDNYILYRDLPVLIATGEGVERLNSVALCTPLGNRATVMVLNGCRIAEDFIDKLAPQMPLPF